MGRVLLLPLMGRRVDGLPRRGLGPVLKKLLRAFVPALGF